MGGFSLVSLCLAAVGVGGAGNFPVSKVRGVNLGGWLVSEPWMMTAEWNRMGCSPYKDEFDCMSNVASAQAGFTSHYSNWITQADINRIKGWGLNTIRIPVGYWIVESTVDKASEHFATGGFAYLKRACGWASSAGINVIIDLHGAPGAQQAEQPFTGQYAPTAGFYSSQYNYNRAYDFLKNMTTEIHSHAEFNSVMNEPVQSTSGTGDMVSNYYPGALSAIRNAESALGITCNYARRSLLGSEDRFTRRRLDKRYSGCLNVQYMDSLWGSGDARSSMSGTPGPVAYDDHQYVKYTTATPSRSGYLSFSCNDDRTAQTDSPVIVGEWSLSAAGDNEHADLSTRASGAAAFYFQWASAQMRAYEKGAGWVFWTYKTDTLNDPRWDYGLGVAQGYLPSTASAWSTSACNGY